jgi:hypothetical protein
VSYPISSDFRQTTALVSEPQFFLRDVTKDAFGATIRKRFRHIPKYSLFLLGVAYAVGASKSAGSMRKELKTEIGFLEGSSALNAEIVWHVVVLKRLSQWGNLYL